MKTAKLFIDGQEYCDLYYHFDNIKNAIDNELNNMDLTEFGQGAEIDFHVEDLDGNLIKVWDSINSIENGTDYKRKTIYACANGQNSTAYGYVWKYCR